MDSALRRDPKAARIVAVLGLGGAAVACALAGCGGAKTTPGQDPDGLPRGAAPVKLDPARFTTRITNRWWPMRPGMRWVYRETDSEGTDLDVAVTVTRETRRIANGVTARVVRDTVTERGRIVEDTFDWYAQDRAGNVWYLGEDTAEFEGGKLTTKEGSFEAGVDGALPGVVMPARPSPGMRYRQEYYKGHAEDRGAILGVDEMAETPYRRFRKALLTRDTTPLEPTVLEYKLYAPGVGPVLVLGVSGGPGSREELISAGSASARWTRLAGTRPLGKAPRLNGARG